MAGENATAAVAMANVQPKAALRRRRQLLALAVATGMAGLGGAARADILANNGGTDLSQAASWFDQTLNTNAVAAPGASDIARWDSLSTVGGTFTLGTPTTSWQGIAIANPGANIVLGTLGDGNALTLGSAGIDNSAATRDLNIQDAVTLGASQTWNVASGRTVSFNVNSTAGATLDLGANTLTINGSGTVSFNSSASIIAGASGGSIVKNGTGTLTFGAVNTYTGSTTITNGTLLLRTDTMLPTSSSGGTFNVATTLNVAGGTVQANGGARSGSSGNPAWIPSIGTLNVQAGSTNFTESRGSSARVIDNFSAITRSAGGTVNLLDTLNSNGTNNANSGGYRLPTAANVNGVVPFMTYTTTTTGTASGGTNNPLTSSWIVGAGSGANGTAYSAFTASTATTLGTSTQNVDVTLGVTLPTGSPTDVNTLRWNSGNSNTVTVGTGDTLTVDAGGILVTGNYGNHTGRITGGTLRGGNPGSGSGQDLIIIDYADPAAGSNAKFQIDSVIADNTSATALTKSGIGLLILTNTANTYTGKTYLNGGITRISGDGSLGAVPDAATPDSITMGGSTLQWGAANVSTSSSRNALLRETGGTIDSNGFTGTFGGVVSGIGSLTKSGVGTVRLAGANTYTGNTIVSAGTLSAVNTSGSATGTGSVSVAAGATLSGSGSVSGAVSLNAGGGHIAPGDNGVGTLSVGSLSFNTGNIADFEFTDNSNYDHLNVANSGGLTLNGGGINLFSAGTTSQFPVSGEHVFNLFQFNGTLNGNSLSVLNPIAGYTYTFGTSGNNVTLDVVGGTGGPVVSAWNTDTDLQSWTVAGNWTNGIPTAAGDTASFLGVITGPRTVNVDAPQIVGMINFNNANSYTIAPGAAGTITLDNGASAAQINDINGSHSITAPLFLTSNTTVTVNNASDVLTITGDIANSSTGPGTATLTTVGLGTLVLTGTNTYGGNTTIGAGTTLQLGNATATGSVTSANVVDNGVLRISRSNAYALNALISGTGSLTQSGAGTTTLGGANTYSGGTTISAGAIKMGNATALGTGNASISAGALLDVNATNPTLPGLNGAGTVDNTAAGATTVTISNTTNATLSGAIQNTGGAVSLVKAGSGTQTLSGTNTYTGGTTINAGILSINSAAALGDINGALTINAGTLEVSSTFSSNRTISLANSGSTIQVDSGQTYTNTGSVGGTALAKTSSGILILSGTNTVSGNTGVTAGELQIPTGASWSTATASTAGGLLHINGGTYNATGTTSINTGTATIETGSSVTMANVSVGGAADAGPFKINGGTVSMGTFEIKRSAASSDFTKGLIINDGTITASAIKLGTANSWGNMIMNGGTVTVNGPMTVAAQQTSTRGGGLRVTNGTLTDTDPAGLLMSADIIVSAATVNNVSTAEFQGGVSTFPQIVMDQDDTMTTSNATVTVGGGTGTGTLYVGSGGIVAHTAGGAKATLNVGVGGVLGASGDWPSTSGNVNIVLSGNLTQSGVFQTADASNVPHNMFFSGKLSGAGAWTINGAGTLTYSGTSSLSFDTNVNGGTLTLAAAGSLGDPAGTNVNVASGATFNCFGTLEPTATVVNVSGTANFGGNTSTTATATRNFAGVAIGSGAAVTITPSAADKFPMILAPGAIVFGDSTSTLDITNNQALLNGTDLNTVRSQIVNQQIKTTAGTTSNGVASADLGGGQIEVAYALKGDANIDGTVNVGDLGVLATNYGITGGRVWTQGDFNYDGTVNVADLGALATNYNASLGGGTSAGGLAAEPLAVATAAAVSGSAAVPEPTSLGLLAAGAFGLMARRSRRRQRA